MTPAEVGLMVAAAVFVLAAWEAGVAYGWEKGYREGVGEQEPEREKKS